MRERIRDRLRAAGALAFIMEEESDEPGEDLVDKFYRLLEAKDVEHVIVYWPAQAKMQTTYDELILLRSRIDSAAVPKIWVLHQKSVARISRGEFTVLERGGRSRYLESVARLGVTPLAWDDIDTLDILVDRVANEL